MPLPVELRVLCSTSRLLRCVLNAQPCQTRSMMYPPNYVEPLTSKEALSQPLPEGDPRRFRPIRAPSLGSCPTIFNDELVAKFVNMIMYDGRKDLAQALVLKTLEKIKRIQLKKRLAASDELRSTIECNPVDIFRQAIHNCTPMLNLRPVKRGGITYQVPSPITEHKARGLALRYIRDACRDKHRRTHLDAQLCEEIMDAYNNEGRCVKRKQELHRQAEANRAYVHFRWSTKTGMKR